MPIKSDLYCKTHEKKLSEKGGRLHYKKGCDVWYFDSKTGEPSHPYGKRAKEAAKPSTASTTTTNKDLGKSGADIEEHVKGFKEPDPEILFIYYPGGKIQRLWDRFPDHQSIYTALVQGEFFKGTPAEFIEASARFMLAAAGYESVPCIIPANMKLAYEETARLISEGVLTVIHGENGKMTLEVNHETEGNHAGDNVTKVGVQPGGSEHQPEQVPSGQEEELSPVE